MKQLSNKSNLPFVKFEPVWAYVGMVESDRDKKIKRVVVSKHDLSDCWNSIGEDGDGIECWNFVWKMSNYRKCTKCRKVKEINLYHRDASKPRGRNYVCIECVKERRKGIKKPKFLGFYHNVQ